METIEKSDQGGVLQVNGVSVDVGVIAKDADVELNNNQTVETTETAEKLVKIPEENLMEKPSEPSTDEQKEESKAQPCEENSMTADNGKEDGKTGDDKPLEGDSEVEPNETVAEEKSADSESSSSSSSSSSTSASATDELSADSESSPTLENTDKTEKSDGSVEELASDAATSTANDTKGHAKTTTDTDADADTDIDTDTETNTKADANTNANADTEQPQQQQNDTETTETTEQTTKAENSPSKSPSKKKSSPKKRKNRSRSQKKPFDYSQLVNYTLSVTQRSRRYFLNVPRGRNVPTPSDDCEIFCSNIPINVLEQELIPLFEKFGKIFELRLMMSMRNPKRNAGFAFVRYTTSESANEAADKLNNYEIVPGKLLSVRLSQPNLSLFVGNIHRGLTREQIHEKIGGKTQGLVKTFVKSSLYETTKNCGFCFLEYDCHSSALSAKRQLNRGNVWGRQLFVDWAQRRKPVNENDLQESKTLFVNYLPKETTEEQITETMSAHGTVEKVTKIKDYAFVLFTEHQAAIDAMNGTDKTKLGNDAVEISLAMPKTMKQHRNRYPSFSYHRTRRNRGGNNHNPSHSHNNRYRSSFGSTGKFFMHKQQPQQTTDANTTDANTTDAAPSTTAGTSAGQTVIPSIVLQPPEQIVVS